LEWNVVGLALLALIIVVVFMLMEMPKSRWRSVMTCRGRGDALDGGAALEFGRGLESVAAARQPQKEANHGKLLLRWHDFWRV